MTTAAQHCNTLCILAQLYNTIYAMDNLLFRQIIISICVPDKENQNIS